MAEPAENVSNASSVAAFVRECMRQHHILPATGTSILGEAECVNKWREGGFALWWMLLFVFCPWLVHVMIYGSGRLFPKAWQKRAVNFCFVQAIPIPSLQAPTGLCVISPIQATASPPTERQVRSATSLPIHVHVLLQTPRHKTQLASPHNTSSHRILSRD